MVEVEPGVEAVLVIPLLLLLLPLWGVLIPLVLLLPQSPPPLPLALP